MDVELRQSIAAVIDAVDVCDILDQRHQAVGDLEDDLAAPLGNHRQVTMNWMLSPKPCSACIFPASVSLRHCGCVNSRGCSSPSRRRHS